MIVIIKDTIKIFIYLFIAVLKLIFFFKNKYENNLKQNERE